MADCDIRISGPGGAVNIVLAVARDALEKAGFDVEVQNEYPSERTLEEQWKLISKVKNPGTVRFSVTHEPCG